MENFRSKLYHQHPIGYLLLYYVLAGSLISIAIGVQGLWNGWHIVDFLFLSFGLILLAIYHFYLRGEIRRIIAISEKQ